MAVNKEQSKTYMQSASLTGIKDSKDKAVEKEFEKYMEKGFEDSEYEVVGKKLEEFEKAIEK